MELRNFFDAMDVLVLRFYGSEGAENIYSYMSMRTLAEDLRTELGERWSKEVNEAMEELLAVCKKIALKEFPLQPDQHIKNAQSFIKDLRRLLA